MYCLGFKRGGYNQNGWGGNYRDNSLRGGYNRNQNYGGSYNSNHQGSYNKDGYSQVRLLYYCFTSDASKQCVTLSFNPYRVTVKDTTKTTTRATITKAATIKEATTMVITASILDMGKATVIKPLGTTSNRATTSSISR